MWIPDTQQGKPRTCHSTISMPQPCAISHESSGHITREAQNHCSILKRRLLTLEDNGVKSREMLWGSLKDAHRTTRGTASGCTGCSWHVREIGCAHAQVIVNHDHSPVLCMLGGSRLDWAAPAGRTILPAALPPLWLPVSSPLRLPEWHSSQAEMPFLLLPDAGDGPTYMLIVTYKLPEQHPDDQHLEATLQAGASPSLG